MAETVKLAGQNWRGLRARAAVEGLGTGGTFTVAPGSDSVDHSASADMSSPTNVAAGATSTTITTKRWLRTNGSNGDAVITVNGPNVGANCIQLSPYSLV